MSNQKYEYPEDLTGRSSDNLIVDEQHSINPPDAMDQYFITPYHTPFFGLGLTITHVVSGYELVPGVDFTPTHLFVELSKVTAEPVYGSISILNSSLNGGFKLTYQTLGGNLAISTTKLAKYLNDSLVNPRKSNWSAVISAPPYFPPLPHQQDIIDVKGMSLLVDSVNAISTAINQKNLNKVNGIATALGNNIFTYANVSWIKVPMISSGGVNDTLISLRSECLSIVRRDNVTLTAMKNGSLVLKHDDNPYAIAITPKTLSGGELTYLNVIIIDRPIAHYRLGDLPGFNFIGDALTSSNIALPDWESIVVDGFNVLTPTVNTLQRVTLPPIPIGDVYTYSFYVKPTTLTGLIKFLTISNTALNLHIGVEYNAGDIVVWKEAAVGVNLGLASQWFTVNKWTHVAFERYDSFIRVYFNGAMVSSSPVDPLFTVDNMRLGDVDDFTGYYSDMRFEKRALYMGVDFIPPVQNTSDPIEMFIAVDEVGDYDGVFNGITLEAPGLLVNDIDTAITFDGIDDSVEILSTGFELPDDFSIEFIIKGDLSKEYISIISKRGIFNTDYSFAIYIHNRKLLWLRSYNGSTWIESFEFITLLQDNIKYHITLTGVRGGAVNAYVNSSRENTTYVAGDSSTYVGQRSVYLGGDINFPDRYLSGVIDELSFYDYAMTQDEVDLHYITSTTGAAADGANVLSQDNRPLEIIDGDGLFLTIFESDALSPAIIRTAASANVTESTVWNVPTTILDGQELRNGFYDNGHFVLFGHNGSIALSPDGNLFTTPTIPYVDTLYAGTYGNDLYVVVGKSDVIFSSNMVDWTALSLPFILDVTKPIRLAYGNGIFILVNENKVYSSIDFTTWKTTLCIVDISDVTFGEYGGNGCFMIAIKHEILTTVNGIDLVSINANGLRINVLEYSNSDDAFIGGDINGKYIHNSLNVGISSHALPIDIGLR